MNQCVQIQFLISEIFNFYLKKIDTLLAFKVLFLYCFCTKSSILVQE